MKKLIFALTAAFSLSTFVVLANNNLKESKKADCCKEKKECCYEGSACCK